MLNPKEYKLLKVEILSYEEYVMYGKRDVNLHLMCRLNKKIQEYEKQGYIVEIGNMTTELLKSYASSDSAIVLYSINVMLYEEINK